MFVYYVRSSYEFFGLIQKPNVTVVNFTAKWCKLEK